MTELVLAFLLGGVAGALGVCGWAWLVASKRAQAARFRGEYLRFVLREAHRELDAQRQAKPPQRQ